MPDYSQREIDHFIQDIRETLVRIENQVIKTNARVTALEKWRWFLAGAFTIVTFFVVNNLINISKLIE
jgi:hypothetical protein